jgi:uncharacterized membrane protein
MNKSNFKTNIIYGVIVLVPVAVIVLALAKLAEVLEQIGKPLGLESAVGTAVAAILAVILLLVVCFVIGALVQTRIGTLSFDKFERVILKQVPGYEIIGNVLKGFAENTGAYSLATVQLHGPGTAMLGFVMENNDNGTITVFIPSTPAMTVGAVHIVNQELVTILDTTLGDFSNCVTQWGIGSNKVLGNKQL